MIDFREEMNETKKKEVEDFKTQIETEVSAYQQALELKAVELKMQEVNVTENNSIASQASTQQALQEQRQKEVRDEAIAKVKGRQP